MTTFIGELPKGVAWEAIREGKNKGDDAADFDVATRRELIEDALEDAKDSAPKRPKPEPKDPVVKAIANAGKGADEAPEERRARLVELMAANIHKTGQGGNGKQATEAELAEYEAEQERKAEAALAEYEAEQERKAEAEEAGHAKAADMAEAMPAKANGAEVAEPEGDGEEEPPKPTNADRMKALGFKQSEFDALFHRAQSHFADPNFSELKSARVFKTAVGRAAFAAAKREAMLAGNNYERAAGELLKAADSAIGELGDGDMQPLLYAPEKGDFGAYFVGTCYRCGEDGFRVGGWDKGSHWASCKSCGLKTGDAKADLLGKAKPAQKEDDPGVKDTLEKLARMDHEPGIATQINFARTFQRTANGDWLHDDDAKQWWHWDGEKRQWRELTHKARDLMAGIIGAATHGDKKLAEKFQANAHVSGALTIASDRCYASFAKDFDANTMLVGLPDGMALNLGNKQPRPRQAKRDDRLTQAIAVVPAKGNGIKQFEEFLTYAFGGYDDPRPDRKGRALVHRRRAAGHGQQERLPRLPVPCKAIRGRARPRWPTSSIACLVPTPRRSPPRASSASAKTTCNGYLGSRGSGSSSPPNCRTSRSSARSSMPSPLAIPSKPTPCGKEAWTSKARRT